jgi:hypothetical protein
MARVILSSILAAVAIAAPLAQAPGTDPAVDLKGKLYKSVFFSGPGALTTADLTAVPPSERPRLERYLRRRAAFASKLQGTASSFEMLRSEAKKRVVERAIVALVETPDIEKAAASYAEEATILYEWQRRADAPISEATAAEAFLKRNTSSPIAPYLYVFIAERHRAAFEMMNVDAQKADMTAAAKKYRTFMQRARAAEDGIFRLLADDMDRQPFLYVSSPFHPRDFDPDS